MISEKIARHQAVFSALADLAPNIERAAQQITNACRQEQLILVCGNGGSAADAQHFAAELTGRYLKNRRAYASVALTTDSSALTAIGNDYGFAAIFSRQIEALGKVGDVLVAISTSGNSENIYQAVLQAQQRGLSVVALLGRDGGKIATSLNATDTAIIVPSDVTAHIQEAHIFLLHYFCEQLED